jgi:hypothetical protein
MTNDLLIASGFVFFDKFFGARKRDLVNILLHFISRHADACIGDRQRFLCFINGDHNFRIAHLARKLTRVGNHLELLDGINGIRNQLS